MYDVKKLILRFEIVVKLSFLLIMYTYIHLSSGHLGQYLVLSDAYPTVDSRLHPDALPVTSRNCSSIEYGSTLSVNASNMRVICMEMRMYISMRGRTTTSWRHFCCACHSASAVTTPYDLAIGHAASTTPLRRSGSPATTIGLFRISGLAPFSILA